MGELMVRGTSLRQHCFLTQLLRPDLKACYIAPSHDQDLAIEPNLAMSAASDATNST